MSSYKLPNKKIYNILDDKKDNSVEELEIETLKSLAGIIKQYRKDNNITNKELAKKCGITTSIMSRLESGYQNVTVETVCKVLNNIGYTVNFIKRGE